MTYFKKIVPTLASAALLFGSATPLISEYSFESREQILELFAGEWVARGLYVATKLNISDHLEKGQQNVEELSQLCHCDKDSLQRVLHMLAGYGIFEEPSEGVFANSKASKLLSKHNPESLKSIATFYGEEIHHAFDELLGSVETATPSFQITYKQPVFAYFKQNPERAALFQEAMRSKSQLVIESCLQNYDFSQFKTLCDVGGGYGQFLRAALAGNPSLKGTLFELPEVIENVRRQKIFIDRLEFASGNFFESVPHGQEAYLLKSVIHDWSDEQAKMILVNCHEAMDKESRLILVEVALQPGNLSQYANCMDVLMLAVTGGKERSLSSFERLLDECGFVVESVTGTSTEFSVIEAKKK